MYKKLRTTLIATCALGMYAGVSSADLIAPTPASSQLTVEVKLAGVMPKATGDNIASPQPYGSKELFLITHRPTQVFSVERRTGETTMIYNPAQTPADISPAGNFALMNVAGNADMNKVYMVFTSRTLPGGIPTRYLPDPDDPSGGRENFFFIDTFNPIEGFGNGNGGSGPLLDRNIYDIDAPDYTLFFGPVPIEVVYQVFVEFDYKRGALSNPRPFLALQTQEGPFHSGGGLIVIPDGRLAYTTGDNLPFGMEGRRAPQDDSSHLSKLLLIDPATGDVEITAKGLRNVQHIQRTEDPAGIAFADIGGVTAEEVNFIRWPDVIDTSTIENFGWGRNADDDLAREGTFYVGPGTPFRLGDQPAAEAMAPVPEPGFEQPLAQYGRGALNPFNFVAASGPVSSDKSFRQISLLMGDLANGEVYATTDKIDGLDVPLFLVNLVDGDGNPIGNSLNVLAGGRSDPRFFLFPNGEAGVLLEATGAYYILKEVRP
jgi:hypothetical protein